MKLHRFILFVIPFFSVWFVLQDIAQSENITEGHRFVEEIPVIAVNLIDGREPVRKEALIDGTASDPQNPYAVMGISAAHAVAPGAIANYQLEIANYESVTRTYHLTNVLPVSLTYLPDASDGLTYDAHTRTLSWRGEIAPGHLDYLIEEAVVSLPYIDLAEYGAINLCDDFIIHGQHCDDVTVTFNLGVNGYTTHLYGQTLRQLTVSANGLILGSQLAEGALTAPVHNQNQWLPDPAGPSFVLAGLWRDVNMGDANKGSHGRWHAAIMTGLVAGHDLFYAQWHDAPQAGEPDLTARHAIAVVLDGEGGLDGHVFFIYDNVSDPAQLVAHGYTIGVEDRLGMRGSTYAYAPCCGQPRPPRGYPPVAGTTLHLRPLLFGATNDYQRILRYQVVVDARVPETIPNTAVATSSSDDPTLAYVWSTHYLNVRWQTYLPLLRGREVLP